MTTSTRGAHRVCDHVALASPDALLGVMAVRPGRLDNKGIRRVDVGVDSIGAEPVPEPGIIDQALAIDPPKYTDG